MPMKQLRHLTGALAAAAAIAAGFPAASLAQDSPRPGPAGEAVDPVVAVPAECPIQPVHQIFSFAGDENWYFLAPGGDFEGGPAWQLGEGVSIVTRRDLTEYFGGGTLRIERDGVATSPEVCVDQTLTHLRTGLRASDRDATLLVEAVVDGEPVELARITGARFIYGWVSPFVPLAAPLGLRPGESVQARLRLTAISGTWEIDGVAIDPKSTR